MRANTTRRIRKTSSVRAFPLSERKKILQQRWPPGALPSRSESCHESQYGRRDQSLQGKEENKKKDWKVRLACVKHNVSSWFLPFLYSQTKLSLVPSEHEFDYGLFEADCRPSSLRTMLVAPSQRGPTPTLSSSRIQFPKVIYHFISSNHSNSKDTI